ncbi:PG1 protein, partial [Bifidobacterium adolescentis]
PLLASRRSLGRISVPMWPVALSGRLPVEAMVGRYPAIKLIGRDPIPYR